MIPHSIHFGHQVFDEQIGFYGQIFLSVWIVLVGNSVIIRIDHIQRIDFRVGFIFFAIHGLVKSDRTQINAGGIVWGIQNVGGFGLIQGERKGSQLAAIHKFDHVILISGDCNGEISFIVG